MPAAIFSGNFVKTLKDQLLLGDTARVLTGTDDPTVVAAEGEQGSLYLRTGGTGGTAFLKQDAGTSTNWDQLEISVSANDSNLLENLGLETSVAANALTISLKQGDGSTDPAGGSGTVRIGFQGATAANGDFEIRSVTSALSLTVSSGSTLGTGDAQDHYLYVYALDNAGTVELAVSLGTRDEGTLISTTAEGGAGGADSGSVVYSATARSNVSFRLIGRLKVNQTTAGTWAANATEVSLAPFEIQTQSARFRAASNTIFTSLSQFNFDTEVHDTHNAVVTWASWNFTCMEPGTYQVSAKVATTNVVVGVNTQLIALAFRNGTAEGNIDFTAVQTTSNIVVAISGALDIQCDAGDTLDVRLLWTGGGSTTSFNNADYNQISISKIGPKL